MTKENGVRNTRGTRGQVVAGCYACVADAPIGGPGILMAKKSVGSMEY